ncbi:hypothetical protein SSX86_002349 [Deinandra increscens subsp. villosa]|uniref:Integrase catalytic domain-containing protein n=1 Tax=Deinandra increscens subsp. villosa TaxID=3103831 RepID=A0AAP0DSP0_9ASTR
MHPTFCVLQDIRTKEIIGRGTERQGLYYVDGVIQNGTGMLAHGSSEREAWLWHRRLGHPSTSYLSTLFPKLFPKKFISNCDTCVLAKSHRQTFKPNNTRVEIPFTLIHSDVWGPAPVLGGQNLRYFLLFINDCTRMTWVYFLKHKSEVSDRFATFHTMIKTQFQKDIQILRSDNGGEFVNTQMKHFFETKGIIHQTSCAHTPEQNGVVERKNRILLEITQALIIESQVPSNFWPEAVAIATYLINRLPTRILKLKTPLQTLSEFTKIPPPLTPQPRIFGCSVFVHIPKGETVNPDTLRWLQFADIVHSTTDESPSNSTQNKEPTISATTHDNYPSILISEVSNLRDMSNDHDNGSNNDNEVLEEEQSVPPSTHEDTPERYVLPPRANRGVPPKRFSPTKETRGSKYPMANVVSGNLSKEAKSFLASIY